MPDRILTKKIPGDPERFRGFTSTSVWKAMTFAERYQARDYVRSGMRPDLMTEVMAERISIKDQHLFVNTDENDPNPLSDNHLP